MVQAYILIQTEVGRASQVVEGIRGLGGVVEVDVVTGNYDAIVKGEAESPDELAKLVVGDIQAVEGITRSITCMVVHV
jgi:DNA-binding Lrp family transcriptional regulator